MPTISPIAFNTGSTIPGTTQIGNLSIGTTSQDYRKVGQDYGVTFYASPDQEIRHIIGFPDITASHLGQPGDVPARIGFYGTSTLNDTEFINLSQHVSKLHGSPQTFATTSAAVTWLNTNGYWTSWVDSIQTVTIGTQIWTTKNLDVTTYRNGDTIPEVTDSSWGGLTTGAWCYVNNDPATNATYGKLYNWYAVNDPRGLAPTGYHIPTDTEFITLFNYLGGATVAGGKMKTTGTVVWDSPNVGATNESGFSAVGAGRRDTFNTIPVGLIGNFWTSIPEPPNANARYCYLQHQFPDAAITVDTKNSGNSVRLIKD